MFRRFISSVDQFGKGFRMNIGPNDKKVENTRPGAILSVFMVAVLAFYVSYKINFVIKRHG